MQQTIVAAMDVKQKQPWIRGYEPRFFTTAVEGLQRHRCALQSLVGQRLERTWLLWEEHDERWRTDAPVLLCFEGRQVELMACKLDHFAITFDSIQPAAAPPAPQPEALCWAESPLPPLAAAIGQRLRAVHLIEYAMEGGNVATAAPHLAWPRQPQRGPWMMNGVEFAFDQSTLVVYNALDENGLADAPFHTTDTRRHPCAEPSAP